MGVNPNPSGERESSGETGNWRIDDLAIRGGVTVDTLRYYQRAGLLPEPVGRGRQVLYGPAHLRRLHEIKDLQREGFTLSVTKKLAERGTLGYIDVMFAMGDGEYTRQDLMRITGISDSLMQELRSMGLIFAGDGDMEEDEWYDNADLQALRAVQSLIELGMPEHVAVHLTRRKIEHVSEMHREVADVLSGTVDLRWSVDDRVLFQNRAARSLEELLSNTAQLLDYIYLRTTRRLTVEEIRRDVDTVGGTEMPL